LTTAFLADACALIVFHAIPDGVMTPAGREAMAGGEVQVAPITVWEILRKVQLGKLPLPVPRGFRRGYPAWLRGQGYTLALFDWEDAALAATLPDHHRDPMDRMLIAAALRHDLTIITSNAAFEPYGVSTLW
jgi:PIN domain nuclease of toxin-antitoxin system